MITWELYKFCGDGQPAGRADVLTYVMFIIILYVYYHNISEVLQSHYIIIIHLHALDWKLKLRRKKTLS